VFWKCNNTELIVRPINKFCCGVVGEIECLLGIDIKKL